MIKKQRDEKKNASPAGSTKPAAHTSKSCYHVLLADDSEDDRFLIRSAVERIPRLKVVGEVANGLEVIAFFNGLGKASGAEKSVPDLLLLDLEMPFKDGFEVLEWLRGREYDNLTVVVLTGSTQPSHIKRALDLGADYYQVKSRSNSERYAMAAAFEKCLMGLPVDLLPEQTGSEDAMRAAWLHHRPSIATAAGA